MVSLITMSGCSAANTGIGAGSSPVLRAGGEALPRVAAEQLTTDRPPRVRAPGRATRSANGSRRCQIGITVGSSARQLPHAQRRRSENWLQFAAGGPGRSGSPNRGPPKARTAPRWNCTERVTPCLPGRRDRGESLRFWPSASEWCDSTSDVGMGGRRGGDRSSPNPPTLDPSGLGAARSP